MKDTALPWIYFFSMSVDHYDFSIVGLYQHSVNDFVQEKKINNHILEMDITKILKHRRRYVVRQEVGYRDALHLHCSTPLS